MNIRQVASTAGYLLFVAALLIGCGSDSGDNSNDNTNSNSNGDNCTQHEDCQESEICDPATSTCVDNSCGDGVVRGSEVCDEGENNGVSPSTCLTDCTENMCGDGYIGGAEQCDGAALGEVVCSTVAGLSMGDLSCSDTCELDASDCHDCGDGALDGPEVCDGTNLGGVACTDVGYDGGALTCQADCMALNESACSRCGDGSCDLADGERTGNCPADCGWVQIDIGGGTMYDIAHTCAVKADGTVWCWGVNDFGQLGNGTYDSTSLPVQVAQMENAVAVTVGGAHTCALKQDQTAWCWGHNLTGQLGTGTFMDATIPMEVQTARPVLSIDAGSYRTTCAVVDDATRLQAVCWGSGSLGVDITGSSPVPLSIEPPFQSVATGIHNSCALHATEAAAYCWGDSIGGRIGSPGVIDSVLPTLVQPPGSIDASQIQLGSTHTCALLTDSTVWCWGGANYGVLGTSAVCTGPLCVSWVPVPVEGLSNTSVSQISASGSITCALGTDQLVYCWGSNWYGGLGDGTTDARIPARALPATGVSGAVYVDAGLRNGCAVTQDGRAYCWGGNEDGQLGIGPAAIGFSVPTPTQVTDPYE